MLDARRPSGCARRCIVGGQDFATREERGRLVYEDERGLLDLPLPRLAGRHQQINAGTAIATLRVFDPDLARRRDRGRACARRLAGAAAAARPRRRSRIGRRTTPRSGSTAATMPTAAACWPRPWANARSARARPLVLVCGMLTTKDPAGLPEALPRPDPGAHRRPGRRRACRAQRGRDRRPRARVGIPAAACASVEDALDYLSARPWLVPPRILITGSLYLAGDVLKLNGTPPT